MDSCNCVVPQWPSDDLLMRYQYVSDFFIALAYFSIPLELIYFVKRSSIFPYRWVLVQFGAFIVLCGATHLISLWTFSPHTRTVAVLLTVAKIFTAIVSCATALMLIHIIPDLLSAKTRELFLKNKAAELDREMGRVRTQEQTGRHGRLLTHEIRSTLDRQTILKITLAELGKALDLEECTLWMPTRTGQELQLTHSLRQLDQELDPVPMHHTVVKQVFSSHRAVVIAPNSPVCLIRSRQGKYTMGDCVGVRVPLLPVNVHTEWPESHSKRAYALMVLMLPCNSARRWHVHELQLVETVADQVAVALSHAAMLEESMRARNLLVEQNLALVVARRDAETAISARNDFLAVLSHEMRTPMHAIIALSSLLQGTQLTPEQRSMVDTILKSSNLLATLINDVLDISRLEDGSLQLEANKFALPNLFKEVMKLVAPITSVKKIKIEISLAIDLPEYVVGDEKRLLQIILIVVGNAIKFTKEGSVSIRVLLWSDRIEYQKEPRSLREPRSQADLRSQRDFQSQRDLNLSRGEQHYYVRVEVVDTGVGLNPIEIPTLFNKFLDADASSTRNYGGTGLGLAVCKRFLNLMGGEIRIESEGPGKGTTVTFTVKLGVPQKPSELDRQISPAPASVHLRTDFSGVKILVTDDNGVNRMVTRGLLMRLGCDVTVVSSGSECLKEIAQPGQSFQVLLLDVCMPEMDGYEVCRRIQQQIARHERPLMVALTANTDKETEQKCMDLGMDGVIIKPISLEKMRLYLTELLQRGSLTPETRRKT